MAEAFEFDVFFSHSSADKAAVRELAERLKVDGLRVWLDEWVILPGDSIPHAIEQGLEKSRTLVMVMSRAAIASEWVTLERHTALFRDPTNQQRRFIPLLLDDCEIKDSLKQFAFVDWREKDEREYRRLLTCCELALGTSDRGTRHFQRVNVLAGHTERVRQACVTTDGHRVVSCSDDGTLRVWDLESGSVIAVLEGHDGQVGCIALSSDGSLAVSGSNDRSMRIWDLRKVECGEICLGHGSPIVSVTVANGRALSRSADGRGRLWDLESGKCIKVVRLDDDLLGGALNQVLRSGQEDYQSEASVLLTRDGAQAVFSVRNGVRSLRFDGRDEPPSDEGRLGFIQRVFALHHRTMGVRLEAPKVRSQIPVTGLAWASQERVISYSSEHTTLALWEVGPFAVDPVGTMEGHTDVINYASATPEATLAVSSSKDGTIRVWNLESGSCVDAIEAGEGIHCVALSPDGTRVIACEGSQIYVWERAIGATVADHQFSRYSNAKVLLVGDSGVGKSGLAIRLTENKFQPTCSTDAHWATQLNLPHVDHSKEVDREIWLWDFAGQADYRLIHQLFMDETALAVLMFNPQSENPFDGLGQWDRDLALSARRAFAKLLVAGRCDRGGLTVSRKSIEEFARERGFRQFFQTSAKTGDGCEVLREAIAQCIDWDSIPWTASPRIFKLLKDEVIRLRDEGFTLLRMSELKQQLEMRLPDDAFTYEELNAVVGLLTGPGHVWRLEFGRFVLLRPECINSYAAAVGRTVRSHLQQIGVIHESAMLAGQLNFGDIERLPRRDEAIVLRAMHQTLVDHGYCLTQETDAGPLLVFPSYFNRERRDKIDHPRIFGTFRFSGALEELYARLVVKLHHTRAFETEDLWRYAADFRCVGGGQVGLKMRKLGEGDAEIMVYCDPDVAIASKVSFIQYIHEHLKRYNSNVTLVRHYVCRNPECGEAVSDVRAILRAREKGLAQLPCQFCFEPIPLWDELEQELASEIYEARVQEMEATSRAGIEQESRDLQLEYHAFAIAEEASQKFVPAADDELGVQARIELIDLAGKPSSRCLYLQLRPAAIFKSVSAKDGKTLFELESKQLVERWRNSEWPVMLVNRTDDGYIRWMDVCTYVKNNVDSRETPIKQIVFEAEPFTALNLLRLRDRMLS